MRRSPLIAIILLVPALALSGCSSFGGLSGHQSAEQEQGQDPESLYVERPTHMTRDHDITARIGPVVNRGDHSVVVFSLDVPDELTASDLNLSEYWGVHPFRGTYRFPIVDLDQGTVEEPARLGDDPKAGDEATVKINRVSDPKPLAAYSVYGPQESSTVDMLIPSVGLVEGIPVVSEQDLPEAYSGEDTSGTSGSETLGSETPSSSPAASPTRPDVRSLEAIEQVEGELELEGAKLNLRKAEIESFTLAVDDGQDVSITNDRVDISVRSDVLFDVDQDVLNDGAAGEIDRVAAQLREIGGGAITVVGHTDDVADDTYNQALSERRAQAVADRLSSSGASEGFTITTEGKGESEPRIRETTAEARAQNRRVEVLVEPQGNDDDVLLSTDDQAMLPATDNPTAAGATGVETVNREGDRVRVKLDEVRVQGRFLVGDVQLTNVGDDDVTWALNKVSTLGVSNPRGQFEPAQMNMAAGLSLLDGTQRYFPVDYSIDGADYTSLLADQTMRLQPGQTDVATVVWPRMQSDTVTLDVSDYKDRLKGNPTFQWFFRLTDVPVRQ